MEINIRQKDHLIEDLEKQKIVLFRENELLAEKSLCMEKDLKSILNNRKQLDSIENIIYQFVSDDKKAEKTLEYNEKPTRDESSLYNMESMSKWALKIKAKNAMR
jgi:hypothetical protein